MLHITAIMEDSVIVARIHDATRATVTFADNHTGKEETRDISCEALGAILALAVGSDEIGAGRGDANVLQSALYEMAESAIVGMDKALRPIP